MNNDININGTTYYDVSKLKVKKSGTNTYAELVDTSDANADYSDIRNGKTAYVNGRKYTGTYTPPDIVSAEASGTIILSGINQQLQENIISFFDHYGSLIYTIDTTDNTQFPLAALPALPTAATGYTFTWDKTLAEVNAMTTGGVVSVNVDAAALTPTKLFPVPCGWDVTANVGLIFKGAGSAVTLTINWGDGSEPSTVNLTGTNQQSASHRFSTRSNNPITITPNDDVPYYCGGGSTSNIFTYYNVTGTRIETIDAIYFGSKALINSYAMYQTRVSYLLLPRGITSLPDNAFNRTYALCTINLPDTITSLGTNAFNQCESLQSIVLKDTLSTAGTRAFYSCSLLKHIRLPASITSIPNEFFYGCNYLEKININSGATSIGDSAFQSCNMMTSISIPDGVTSIGGGAFTGCAALRSISIPSSVTSIGASAFYQCTSIKNISIPNGITRIETSTFSQCKGLTSVNLPSSVTTIGNTAFSYCSSLTSITIPDSVTSIGNQAFQNCKSLTSFVIPSSVTSIGSSAFADSANITKVIVQPITPPTLGSAAFYKPSEHNRIQFQVPAESLTPYKTATNWSRYADGMIGA